MAAVGLALPQPPAKSQLCQLHSQGRSAQEEARSQATLADSSPQSRFMISEDSCVMLSHVGSYAPSQTSGS